MKILKRFIGYAWGAYPDYKKDPQLYGSNLSPHIEAQWTTPEHWAHNNYQRGHLPQLCILASGWKARLLALFFWPPPPFEPYSNKTVWDKNGDHPDDDVWRPFEDTGKVPIEPREGKIVRYFRHPTINGQTKCSRCGQIMHNHGWIDNGSDGIIVCPGDIIVKSRGKYKVKHMRNLRTLSEKC
jgi:hypothetical protein